MSNRFGVYHDVDGCMLTDDKGGMVYRSTFYCKYNDINVPQTLIMLVTHGVIDRAVISMFREEFGDVRTAADVIRLGEYARFNEKPKSRGVGIGKESLAEIERRATKGLSKEALYQSLHDARLTPGLEQFSEWARRNNGSQFIVTDGWKEVGDYLAERLGFGNAYVIGSTPVFIGGRFTGEVRKLEDKKPAISRLLAEMGTTYLDSIGIDDANSVIAGFGLPIAFCPTNPKLRENPKITVVEEPHYGLVQKAAEKWLNERLF